MKAICSTLSCLLSLFLIPSLSLAEPTAAEYGVVLNLSGKQRMLSQKMSKEILFIALDVQPNENLAYLEKTAALFQKTLKGLKEGDAELRLPPTSNERILRQLDETAKIWDEYKNVVDSVKTNKKVTKEQVAQVNTQSVTLVEAMNRCVKLYEKDASAAVLQSDPGLAVTINLSGKQRMLSQKMTKEFLLVVYGEDADTNRLNLLETITLFDKTLTGFLDGDATLGLPATKNEAIRQQLKTVQALWQDYKTQLEPATKGNFTAPSKEVLEKIATSNLPLLAEMNKAVEMYEKEAGK